MKHKIKLNQKLWSKINIQFELKEHNFTEMLNRLNKQNDKIKEKEIDHKSCRVSFRNKIKAFQESNVLIDFSESSSE